MEIYGKQRKYEKYMENIRISENKEIYDNINILTKNDQEINHWK